MTVLETVTTEREATQQSSAVGYRVRTSPRRSRLVTLANDVVASSAASIIVFGWLARDAPGALRRLAGGDTEGVAASVLAAALPLAWAVVLFVHRGYERSALGLGVSVDRRIVAAAMTLAAVVPPLCLVAGQPGCIGAAVLAIPLAAVFTILSRKAVGAWTRMLLGEASLERTLVVGPAASVFDLVLALRREHASEMRVAGVCLVDPGQRDLVSQLAVPVLEGPSGLVAFARCLSCQTVVLAPSGELEGLRLRRLVWELHDCGVDLIVAPSLAEAAPQRITITDAGGRMLLHVKASRFRGPRWLAKDMVDRVLAAVLVVLASPVLLVVAIAVRLSSQGPILYRQIRVGRDGKEFVCFKFRTMRTDADALRKELAHLNERAEGVLFKIRNDPRVTRTGALLRRSSLDELPQLFNVLRGEMSLVGPRPPLPSEVAAYDHDVRRRLRVKPGITGLWQVSGRSELPWPEAVRLDLAYVDNWCPSLDIRILLRTAAAVVRGTGAY